MPKVAVVRPPKASKKAAGKKPAAPKTSDSADTRGLAVESVTLDSIFVDAANARVHDNKNLEAIRASLRQFGQTRPLVVQKSTGKIMAGNGTYTAIQSLGWSHVDVVKLDFNDTQAAAYGIADNRTSELSTWDPDALENILTSLSDTDVPLDALGFADADLDSILGPPEALVAPESDASLDDDAAASSSDSDAKTHEVKIRPVLLTQEQREVFEEACSKLRTQLGEDHSEGRCIELMAADCLSGA